MATTISTRFFTLTWYGPDTNVADLPAAARIDYARTLADDKGSFVSYTKERSINSLGVAGKRAIKAGDQVTLYLNGITAGDSSTYVTIDNGTTPTTTTTVKPNPESYGLSSPAADALLTTNYLQRLEFNRPTISVVAPSGSTLAFAVNGGGFLAVGDANAAIQQLTDSVVKAGYPIAYQLTKTNAVAAQLTVTYSY